MAVNPTPVNATVFSAGLVRTKLIVLVPPMAIVLGVNDFVIVGGATTVSVAEEGLPVPPLAEVGVTVLVPVAVPVTEKESVHEPLTGNVTPESMTDDAVTTGPITQELTVGVRLAN